MTIATLCFALLLVYFGHGQAFVDPVLSIPTRLQTTSNHLHTRLAIDSQIAERTLDHARKLRQSESVQNCVWIKDSKSCVVSEAKEIDIFVNSDNPDAEYFSDHMLCDNFEDFGSCYEAGCLWTNGGYCTYGVTRRELANCFRNATLFLHQQHQRTICSSYEDEIDCEDDIQCNWQDSSEDCALDSLYLMTSVPSRGGFPEGFRPVFARMRTAAVVALNEDYPTHRSLVENVEDLLTWKPPPFDCPEDTYQLACDYAEPLVLSVPIGTYCDIKHGRDFESCAEDEKCRVYEGSTLQCSISVKEVEKLANQAFEVYIDAIHDEFLADVVYQNFNCSHHETISRCEAASCQWARAYGCVVSDAQIREAYLKDLDDDIHPVCHALVAADRHACDEISSSSKCDADKNCKWDSIDRKCYATEQSIINYILENDKDLNETYQKVAEGCATQKTKDDCKVMVHLPKIDIDWCDLGNLKCCFY